jgi:hypothetical protein
VTGDQWIAVAGIGAGVAGTIGGYLAVEGAINSLSEITGLEPVAPASAEELGEHSGPS